MWRATLSKGRKRASQPVSLICQAMLRPIHPAILLALVTALGAAEVFAGPPTEPTDASAVLEGSSRPMRVRLAATLTRYAREVLGTEPLSVEGLSAGTSFLIDATTLNPDAEESWRLLLDVAILTEREDLVERALPAIVRLSPGDTAARLKRLWLAIDEARSYGDGYLVIQEYLEEAVEGEKRLLWVGGQVMGAYLRERAPGEFRHNLKRGGTPRPTSVTEEDHALVQAVNPVLTRQGIWLAGLDVIGGKLVEVNTLNPGGFHFIQEHTAERLAPQLVASLVERIRGGEPLHGSRRSGSFPVVA